MKSENLVADLVDLLVSQVIEVLLELRDLVEFDLELDQELLNLRGRLADVIIFVQAFLGRHCGESLENWGFGGLDGVCLGSLVPESLGRLGELRGRLSFAGGLNLIDELLEKDLEMSLGGGEGRVLAGRLGGFVGLRRE